MFAYMEVRREATHNGGNDAVFELQALIASMCLTVEQSERLRQGEGVQPMLPAMWEAGLDWTRGKIGAAGDYVGTEGKDCLEIVGVDGVEAFVADNSEDVHDSRRADHTNTVIVRDAASSSILPIIHAASAQISPITTNTHTGLPIVEITSIGRPQTSAAMWAAFRR